MSLHSFPFTTAGEMGGRIRDHPWHETALGGMDEWSPTLWSALGICLHSSFPTAIYWGADHHLIYNDAWTVIAGSRHPEQLGVPAREVWSENWHAFAAELATVRARRCGFAVRDAPLRAAPGGTHDGDYWDYSLTPIVAADGVIAGILNQGQDTTARVHAANHAAFLARLDDMLIDQPAMDTILAQALPMIAAALGAERIGYALLDTPHGLSIIQGCWTDGTLPPVTGTRRLTDFHALDVAMRAGLRYVVQDAGSDPHLDAAEQARLAARGIRSQIAVPVVRHGDSIAVLFAHDRIARRWPAHRQALAVAAAERLAHAITQARDTTAEHHRQTLVNELNHRVKNMLALVQGLALQTFRDGQDLAHSRRAFQSRLAALARAHDLLTRGHWEGADVAALVSGMVSAESDAGARISVAGPPLTIAPKQAVSLALALHELLANAAAYGALASANGRVSVTWTTSAGRLVLHWRETGGPSAAHPRAPGFGVRMIQRALATDFGGRVELDFAANGLVFMLDAPLPVANVSDGET